jgi:hypothetical protein
MERIQNFTRWFWTTSAIVGAPVLLLLLIVGIQRAFFTLTCETAGVACEYSFSRTDAMASYVGDILASNPDGDLVMKPKHKR